MNDSILQTQVTNVTAFQGEVLPYLMRNDVVITLLLIISFLLFLWFFTRHSCLIKKRTSDFFFSLKDKVKFSPDNDIESGLVLFIIIDGLILMSVLTLHFCLEWDLLSIDMTNSYLYLGKFFLIFFCFFLFKALFYIIVNRTFFSEEQDERWKENIQFILCFVACFLFPVAAMAVYLDILPIVITILSVLVLLVSEIMIFFKAIVVFFKGKYKLMQIFLYLCIVEIIPLIIIVRVIMKLIKT